VDILAGIYRALTPSPSPSASNKQEEFSGSPRPSLQGSSTAHLQYTFRPSHRRPVRGAFVQYINEFSQEKFKKPRRSCGSPLFTKTAPYGTDVALGSELKAKELGSNVVLKEGYSISAPASLSRCDQAPLGAARRAVHTGYNPDIAALRAAGHGAGAPPARVNRPRRGHSQIDKAQEAFGAKEITASIPSTHRRPAPRPKKLKPGVAT